LVFELEDVMRTSLIAVAAAAATCRLSQEFVVEPAACAKIFTGTIAEGGACIVNEECVSARCIGAAHVG
jgi:hypothetical protein